MDEPLDLTKILKGCEGVELWSDFCGICKLKKIHYDYSRPIVIKSKYSKHLFLMKDGKYYTEGKCMLWPSETNRDWSTFKKPIKEGLPCMCKNSDSDIWVLRTERQSSYTYCVPVDNFDFDDIENNISRSIV